MPKPDRIENYKYSQTDFRRTLKLNGNSNHLSNPSSDVLKLTVQSDNITAQKGGEIKPRIPPKPCHLKITNKWSKKTRNDGEQGQKKEEKPRRKGNSLPITSLSSPLAYQDKTKKSFSLNCVVDRSQMMPAPAQESLFQRFVKEATGNISVSKPGSKKCSGIVMLGP